MADDAGHIHTLTVYDVTVPPGGDWFGEWRMVYGIEHPSGCKQVTETCNDGVPVVLWDCAVAWHERDGLAESLAYSGTPVDAPGSYRIEAWHGKIWVPDYGTWEHDAGVRIADQEEDSDG